MRRPIINREIPESEIFSVNSNMAEGARPFCHAGVLDHCTIEEACYLVARYMRMTNYPENQSEHETDLLRSGRTAPLQHKASDHLRMTIGKIFSEKPQMRVYDKFP